MTSPNRNEDDKYLKIIRRSGLIHASSRRLPLIAASCVFFGYNNILKKNAGYSYGTMGALGIKDNAYFLINEDKVGQLFGKFIKRRKVGSFVRERAAEFKKNRLKVLEIKSDRNYFRTLEKILEIYPLVLSQIGFYQSAMRYVKDNKDRARTLGGLAPFVAKDKDAVANLIYPQIEPLLKKCAVKVGEKYGFDGGLLMYMTLREFRIYLLNKVVTKKQQLILRQRRRGYVYIYHKGVDHIVTDKAFFEKIHSGFINSKKRGNVLTGVSAYPGKVKGRVFRSFHGIKNAKQGHVLVTNMTRPQDNVFMKKFIAIITDEGGTLSHASILARELKIPCIISTKIATQVFENGDLVEVDADRGIVKKI
ncbi:hypothetical protein D4R52_01355 [bacterium]|nr:MAG: hypothetical protein D4R52_01355 [bacterium]